MRSTIPPSKPVTPDIDMPVKRGMKPVDPMLLDWIGGGSSNLDGWTDNEFDI